MVQKRKNSRPVPNSNPPSLPIPVPALQFQESKSATKPPKKKFTLRRPSWKGKSISNNNLNTSAIESNNNNNSNNNSKKGKRLKRKSKSVGLIDDSDLSDKIFLNRQKVYGRLRKNKTKKDVLIKLETSINKVEEKLKSYVRQLVSIQNDKHKVKIQSDKETSEWESLNQWEILNDCRSYYLNYNLLIDLREEISRYYCKCFSDKYKELKKTYDRIKKELKNKKYSLDDLILSVEAAIMTASNIRLPNKIFTLKNNELSLTMIVKELKNKYDIQCNKIMKPMSIEERTKHLLTLLVQCCDEKKEYYSKHNYNGLPYYHSIDNGKQIPFEQILYDPRFNEKKIINSFYNLILKQTKNNKNNSNTIKAISKFIFKLCNEFLNSCSLNKNNKIYKNEYWDATHLMISRNIFPKFKSLIINIVNKDETSKQNDIIYNKRLKWLYKLNQKQLLIDPDFILKNPNNNVIPYGKPINRLQSINAYIVPQDSLVCLIDTIHDIQTIAIEYYKLNNNNNNDNTPVVAGDILFPIVVYVIIKTNINNWHSYIHMIQQFYNKKILTFGQTGFCFSLLSASIQYIMQQKPSNFGLKNSIEDN